MNLMLDDDMLCKVQRMKIALFFLCFYSFIKFLISNDFKDTTLNVYISFNSISYLVAGCWSDWIKLLFCVIIAIFKRIQLDCTAFEWTLNCEWNFNLLPSTMSTRTHKQCYFLWNSLSLFLFSSITRLNNFQMKIACNHLSAVCCLCCCFCCFHCENEKFLFILKLKINQFEMRSEFKLRYDWSDHYFSRFKVPTWYGKKETDRYILFCIPDSTTTHHHNGHGSAFNSFFIFFAMWMTFNTFHMKTNHKIEKE